MSDGGGSWLEGLVLKLFDRLHNNENLTRGVNLTQGEQINNKKEMSQHRPLRYSLDEWDRMGG